MSWGVEQEMNMIRHDDKRVQLEVARLAVSLECLEK